MEPLKIHSNHRNLATKDGKAFFWLGDTAWELFHKCTKEDALYYLTNRGEKGFNVVQAVALSEFDGIRVPNAYGRVPLLEKDGRYDVLCPDTDGPYSYWDHVDFIIDAAGKHGIYIGFLPTWGDKYNIQHGKGPELFTPDNAYLYGKWLGERYQDRRNIVWILGGDRPLDCAKHFDIIRNMAKGIKDGGADQLMTFHPYGNSASSFCLHEEGWLDMNMVQTGHALSNTPTYEAIKRDYARIPVKPVLDGEPRYEDHPVGFNAANGYFDDSDVRHYGYWSVLSGGCGFTYGHHSVWGMNEQPSAYFPHNWKTALDRPGAFQLQYLKGLMEMLHFEEMSPDPDILLQSYTGEGYITALSGKDAAVIYTPCGLPLSVDESKLRFVPRAYDWFNPRSGEWSVAGDSACAPTTGRNDDWVLVIRK